GGGGDGAAQVGAADEDQRPVVLGDLVEEHVEVQGQRIGHAVLRVVRGEVVVPLPRLAGERYLGVDLRLLDVELIRPEDLPRGLHESRVPAETRIDLAAEMEAHGRPDLHAGLLADVTRGLLGEQARDLRAEDVDLRGGEEPGEDQETLRLEVRQLGRREPHGTRIDEAAPGLSRRPRRAQDAATAHVAAAALTPRTTRKPYSE